MTLPVRFRPEARAELRDTWTWYEEQRPGLGDEFLACVEAAIKSAARMPELYPEVHGEVRRVLVRRFPYGCTSHPDGLSILQTAGDHTVEDVQI